MAKLTEIVRAINDRVRIFSAVTGFIGGGVTNIDGIATRATGNITFAANPTAGHTITINGVTFTFVAAGAVGNQINIAATLALTLANMTTVLNASVVGAVILATYSDDAATKLFAKYDNGGSNGNAFTLAASNATVSTANLVGGMDFGDANTGGASALVVIAGVVYWYRLVNAATAEASPEVIRPDDFDATAHTRVWLMQSIGLRNFFPGKTITAPGTTGAQTINKLSGRVNFAAAAQTLVVTNSLVDANSVILATVHGDDATAHTAKISAQGAGSFTIKLNAAAAAETPVDFSVTN